MEIWLGDGWYKGRYMAMGPSPDRNKYGDRLALDAPPEVPAGGTDMVLIATAYYSTCLHP